MALVLSRHEIGGGDWRFFGEPLASLKGKRGRKRPSLALQVGDFFRGAFLYDKLSPTILPSAISR
jgi:hypothetical protein